MRKALWITALAGALMSLSSCQEDDILSLDGTSNNGIISFLVDSDIQDQIKTKGDNDVTAETGQDLILISQNGDSLMFSSQISDISGMVKEAQMPLTRGIPATDSSLAALYGTDAKNGIGILSFWSESATTPFIQNDYLKYDSNGKTANEKWIANAGPYYWPKTGSLDFWAWAPNTIDTNKYNVTRTFSKTGVVNGGKIAFAYDLGKGTGHGTNDAKMQPDLVFSKVAAATTNPVAYHMDHALAAVRFKVLSTETVTVKSISLVDVSQSGSCVYDPVATNKFTWTLNEAKNTYIQVFNTEVPEDEDTATDVSMDVDGTIFMMLPQPVTGTDRAVEITVQSGTDAPVTYSGKVPALEKGWEAGKMYTYTLKVEGGPLDIEVSETFNGSVKNDVQVQNTGGKKAYTRMAVVANWMDTNGNIVMTCDWMNTGSVTGKNWGSDKKWKYHTDGWFYYMNGIKPKKFTEALFSSYTPATAPYPGLKLKMTIIAQGVEYDSYAANAKVAWGNDIDNILTANLDN